MRLRRSRLGFAFFWTFVFVLVLLSIRYNTSTLISHDAPAPRTGVRVKGTMSPARPSKHIDASVAMEAEGPEAPSTSTDDDVAALDKQEEEGGNTARHDPLRAYVCAGHPPSLGSTLTQLDRESSDEAAKDEYPLSAKHFPGVRQHRNVCFYTSDDRLVTKPAPRDSDFVETPAFIFRDVCALGHTPKDITHLYTFAQTTGIRLSHVLFGHRCMARTLDPVSQSKDVVLRRAGVFHGVLRHWFDTLRSTKVFNEETEFYHYEDFATRNATTPRCYRLVLERHEFWRWFDRPSRALGYAKIFQEHFGLKVDVPAPSLTRKLSIVVVKRDEDRHFEERKLVRFLSKVFGAVADVTFAQYDKPPPNKLNAENNVDVPSYEDQMQTLHKADVLIAAHGAVLSSIVAMRRGTAVIELFPHNFRYYMYDELARLLSLHYFPFESARVVGDCCPARNLDVPLTRETINGDRKCKKCDVGWTESEMYYLVKNAMSTVWLGYARKTDIHDFDIRK